MPGCGREQDRDLVAAVRSGLVVGVDAHREAGVGHREGCELRGHRVGEARCGVGAQLGEPAGEPVDLRLERRDGCLQALDALVVAVELDESEAARCAGTPAPRRGFRRGDGRAR